MGEQHIEKLALARKKEEFSSQRKLKTGKRRF